MPCYKPLFALVRRPPPGVSGKASVVFPKGVPSKALGAISTPTPIPCGQCIGCRLERSRQWAIRLMKENKLHDRSSFLTLTYTDDHLPFHWHKPCGKKIKTPRPTLNTEDIQLFLKRLRKHFSPQRLRFFQCGEYGDETLRPHHHMILFGEDFCKDRVRVEDSRSGFPQYKSPLLHSLWAKNSAPWEKARITISDVAFESAAYVARYALKKISGPGASFILRNAKPEYVTMSRNPGIASAYFEEYLTDIYPHDEVVIPGRPASLPPAYFDKLLEKVDPALYENVKKKRTEGLDFYSDPNSTDTRLATRERVKKALIKNCLKRSL